MSERQSRGGRAEERERERDWARMSSSSMQAVLPARQSFYEFPLTLSLSLCSHVHRTHSFLLSGHCRERTDRNHHGIGIRPGKRGKIKPLLSSSLFFPVSFFLAPFSVFSHLPHLPRCLSTVSEGIELKKNEDYNFFLALSRGVFRPLGAGDRGFPQLSADR